MTPDIQYIYGVLRSVPYSMLSVTAQWINLKFMINTVVLKSAETVAQTCD